MGWCMGGIPEGKMSGVVYFHPLYQQGANPRICRGVIQGSMLGDRFYRGHFEAVAILQKPLEGSTDYLLDGSLIRLDSGRWRFTEAKKAEAIPVKGSFSLYKLRYTLKKRLRGMIEATIKDPESSDFVGALLTAEINSTILRQRFSQLGIIHVLAISGFHFSWIAFALLFCLRSIPHVKVIASSMIVLLSAYFLFIGSSPPTFRAWLLALFYFVSLFIESPYRTLNALGVTLLMQLILFPSALFSISFQLSYLATFAILTLYNPFEKAIQRLLSRYNEVERMGFTLFEKCLYLTSILLRKALAISICVQLVLTPLLIYHFGYFSISSLIYNLFFPLLVIPLLCMLLIALPLYAISVYPLRITGWYADFLTTIAMESPKAMQEVIWLPPLSWQFPALCSLATILFGLKAFYYSANEPKIPMRLV